jgi:hypothetical protein
MDAVLNDYYPMGIKDAIMTVQQPYSEAITGSLNTLKPINGAPISIRQDFVLLRRLP